MISVGNSIFYLVLFLENVVMTQKKKLAAKAQMI